MLFGHCPYQSNSIANLIEVLNTQTLAFPSSISPYLKNIITRMLTKDPMQRIGWMELFQIKINSEGKIEETKPNNKILESLQDAKISDENLSISSNSSKIVPFQTSKNESILNEDSQNGSKAFKKNRNQVQNA